jgi:hypothetical protein
MKRIVLALALAAATGAASASSINTAYRVTGHADAAPVQVFDDGNELYVQLRDPARVPAPFVNGQPAQYRIRGPYLVLPLLSAVELRLGAAVVTVTRSGMPAGQQAKVFTSVDPLAPGSAATMPGSSVQVAVAPATPPSPSIPSRGVVGEIALERDPAKPVAPVVATQAAGSNSGRTAILHITPATRPMFAVFRGKRVVVTADGTVAGARHAERLRAVCTVAGPSACSIRYRGAAAGTSTLETL